MSDIVVLYVENRSEEGLQAVSRHMRKFKIKDGVLYETTEAKRIVHCSLGSAAFTKRSD